MFSLHKLITVLYFQFFKTNFSFIYCYIQIAIDRLMCVVIRVVDVLDIDVGQRALYACVVYSISFIEHAVRFLGEVHTSNNAVLLTAQQARLYCLSMPRCCANFVLWFLISQFCHFFKLLFLKFITLHLAESVLCVYNAHLSFLFNYSFTVITSYIHTSGCHQLRLLSVYYLQLYTCICSISTNNLRLCLKTADAWHLTAANCYLGLLFF